MSEYERHFLYQDAVIGKPFDHEILAQEGKGIVRLSLPGMREVVAFKFAGGYQDNDGTSWYAEAVDIQGETNPTGALHIVTAKGAPSIMGTVSYDGALYEFMPAEKGYVVLYRVDNEELANLGSCMQDVVENKPKEKEKPVALDFNDLKSGSVPCGRGDVTILLMTSPAARAEVPANNINYVINTAVAQLKQSLANAAVSLENVNIKTVSPVLATSFMETGPNDIVQNVDTLSILFGSDRQANNADLVVMFTGNIYNGNGRAEAVGPDQDRPYAIVEILSATSKTLGVYQM